MSLSVKALEKIIGVSADHAAERLSELTPRESEVTNLLADGLEPRKIAEELGISPKTLDVHRGKVKLKLGVKTTVDLARFVLIKRLVDAVDGVGSKDSKRRARAH